MSTETPRTLSDAELERLSLFLDGALPPNEAAEVERLVASDPAWQAAHRALKITGEMLRAPVERHARAARFDGLWAGIEKGLPSPERVPSLLDRLKAFLSPPVLLGLAAAAAAAAYVATRPAPAPPAAPATPEGTGLAARSGASGGTIVESEPVIIEGIESAGQKTVLVSQPVEPNGATIIWTLDSPGGEAPPSGEPPPASDDDPI
jgi:anti-sigma factor RsiW